jgi:hypothetical protein
MGNWGVNLKLRNLESRDKKRGEESCGVKLKFEISNEIRPMVRCVLFQISQFSISNLLLRPPDDSRHDGDEFACFLVNGFYIFWGYSTLFVEKFKPEL